jgi:hypothetical protein
VTIAIVQEVNTNTSTSSLSSISQLISSTTAGNALICSFGASNGPTITGISDTQSNTWHSLGNVQDSGMSRQLQLWVAYGIPGGNTTVTVTTNFAQSQYGIFVTEVGPCSATPIDGYISSDMPTTGTGSNVITTGSSGGSTNSTVPALSYGVCLTNQIYSFLSAGTGFTARTNVAGSSNMGGGWMTESKVLSSTGAQAATFGISSSGAALVFLVNLDQAATGTAYTLTGSQGSYALSGVSATLTGAGSTYTLMSNAGTYNYVGAASTSAFQIDSSVGSYTLTGIAAGLNIPTGFSLSAAVGNYALSGQNTTLFVSAPTLFAGTGTYTISGIGQVLTYGSAGTGGGGGYPISPIWV